MEDDHGFESTPPHPQKVPHDPPSAKRYGGWKDLVFSSSQFCLSSLVILFKPFNSYSLFFFLVVWMCMCVCAELLDKGLMYVHPGTDEEEEGTLPLLLLASLRLASKYLG